MWRGGERGEEEEGAKETTGICDRGGTEENSRVGRWEPLHHNNNNNNNNNNNERLSSSARILLVFNALKRGVL